LNKKLLGSAVAIITFVFGFFIAQYPWNSAPESKDLASTTSAAPALSGDLLADTQNFQQMIGDTAHFTAQNCEATLHAITTTFGNVDPKSYDLNQTRKNFLQVIDVLWQTRLSLRQRLREFVQKGDIKSFDNNNACVNASRDFMRMARFTEDYLGEQYLGIPPFNEDKDPKASNTLQGEAPHLMKAPGVDQVTLRSGDLILSRGTAYTSAAIARVGVHASQFSHLAVIYIENEPLGKEFTIAEALKNPHVKALEAHIEVGSVIRPFKDYVADGNARNFLFRYPDAQVAHSAAKWAFDFLNRRRLENQKKNGGALDDPNNNVPYDFHMNLGDLAEIFCSEMGYVAYHSVGVTLPEFSSTLESNNDVIQTLGVTKYVNFAPGDLELDTRFEPIAEWRDYRKVHTIRYKDAALSAMFRWMKNQQYHLHADTFMDLKALFGWLTRHADFSFTKTQLPKNMSVATLKMVFTLDKIGTTLENYLSQSEDKYHRANGHLLTSAQMETLLERFRKQDAQDYVNMNRSQFHFEFHSQDEFNQREKNDASAYTK
jgi:hypothetical protein